MKQSEKGLHFKKAIVATPKEHISTKELLARLQSLSDELSAIDQEKTDVDSLKQIERDVVNKKLLTHSNSGVQAYLCCAISDLLRITAPNAPFTAGELSTVFRLFFKQLRKLSDQENTYFQQQCYLLKRLAEVRSIILITDLPDAEELIQIAFETFYDLSTKNFPAKLEPLASEILSEVISESDSIPHKVLWLILDKFATNPIESSAITLTTRLNIYNPGLNFSVQVCEQNLDRMSRQIAQYFSEILYDNSNSMYENREDVNPNSSRQDRLNQMQALEKLQKIHDLSIQIWKYVPELLGSVMGLIDDELNADEVKIRALATETIGRMIGSLNYVSGSWTNKVNFFIVHKETWGNWLRKTTDVSYHVRAKWVEQLPPIVNCVNSSTSDISEALRKCLHKCLLDSDENVRLAACRSIRQFSFDDFTNKICKSNIMSTLGHLTREKNSEVRSQAIQILAEIYDKYMKVIANEKVVNFGNISEEENNQLKNSIIKEIPNQVLSLVYINDRNINATVDLTLFEKLIPIAESNSAKRIDRLLNLYCVLDEKSKQSFLAINKRQQKVSNAIRNLIILCEELRGKTSTEEKENEDEESKSSQSTKSQKMMKLEKIFKWLCLSFPDGTNTYNCLNRFSKLGKARYLYLMKLCISPESDYNTIRNSIKELLVKLSDSKNLKVETDSSNILASDMVSVFKLLLLRGSVILYNKSNVVELLNYSKDKTHHWNTTANDLLEQISIVVPDVFKLHMSSLIELVTSSRETSPVAISHNLRTIYYLVKTMPEHFPKSFEFLEALKSISLTGSPKEAKYAIRILGLSGRKELYSSQLIDAIFPLKLESGQLATHLSVIAELYLVDSPSIIEKSSELTSLLIKDVFLKNRNMEDDSLNDGGNWISFDELERNYKSHSTLNEKLIAIKILVNKLIALEQDMSGSRDEVKEKLMEQGSPVFKLLVSFIGNAGEIINKKSPTWPTPEPYKSRLRLAAGLSIIKLAKYPEFNEMIYPTTIRRLTFLLSDPVYVVRQEFMQKLNKYLVNDSISERFISVIFFSANEPSNELRNNASMWIRSLYKRDHVKHGIRFEKSLVRIIHIISHHEQFSALLGDNPESEGDPLETNEDNLMKAYEYAADFIVYFLNLIATPENVSLLYYFASRVKQHRDATISPELYDSQTRPTAILNLYRISELAQLVIKEYCDQRNWPMQTWPGKLKLPTDIYSQMTGAKEVQSVITTIFIPDKIQISLQIALKKKLSGSSHKRTSDQSHKEPKPKKVKVIKSSTKGKMNIKKMSSEQNQTHVVRKSSRKTNNVNYAEEQDRTGSASSSSDEELSSSE